ncbi:hypothetical protein K469DRAFT_213326 [Zopfia rhizophila CBS 207.26]|uniref:C2H2-type domain-containing protein n=1 Tax=Zopfia rhizophila CBS 207.26 TaxID=1314779 RepID=A0A6A6DVN2_9PEZI|nr:hypothetical protein K469DRAFT_213326 [Zopfia rhizophila CBS 207.26]
MDEDFHSQAYCDDTNPVNFVHQPAGSRNFNQLGSVFNPHFSYVPVAAPLVEPNERVEPIYEESFEPNLESWSAWNRQESPWSAFHTREERDLSSETMSACPTLSSIGSLNGIDGREQGTDGFLPTGPSGFIVESPHPHHSALDYNLGQAHLSEVYTRTPEEPAISQPVSNEIYFCPEGCLKKTFKRPYERDRHIREQHRCPHEDCQLIRFATPQDRKHHEKLHGEAGLGYKCGSCELNGYSMKALTRADKLGKHFKDAHQIMPEQFNYLQFQCKERPCYVGKSCGGTFFISLNDLKRHISCRHLESLDDYRPEKPEHASAGSMLHPRSRSEAPNGPSAIGKRGLNQGPELVTKRRKDHLLEAAAPQPEVAQRIVDDSRLMTVNGSLIEKEVQQMSTQPPSPNSRCDERKNARCQSDHYERTLIQPIKMIELWDLIKHNDLPSVIAQLQSIHISPIFNKARKSIKLRGPCSLDDMEKGKNLLEPLIQVVRRKAFQKDETETPACKRGKKRFRHKKPSTGQPKIFAIDPAEDKEAIKTWRDFIRPQLREVVGDLPIGDSYTVTLVRQKGDHGVLIPVIRFQSSAGQATLTRNIIRSKINNLCQKNNRPEIQVQFSEGAMVRLVGGNSSQYINDDDPPSDARFPHQCRYFQKPGMGASIGMSKCSHISATLGGYILINGKHHMLTVDHFIWEARECPECGHEVQPNSLNSPSPSDVGDMKGILDKTLEELELQIQHSMTEVDIRLSEVPDLFTEELRGLLEQYTRFRQDLDKKHEQFELGKLVQRSGLDTFRAPTVSRDGGDTVISHRMDWAVFLVDEQRQGMNKYRHPIGSGPGLQDFKDEITNPEGAGAPCEGAREFRGTEIVHYIGNFSGYREGTINAEPVVVIDEHGKRTSQEWAIVPSGSQIIEDDVRGDSGAWVLGSDGKLLGLLWGYDNHLLLVTPIREVFADISRAMNDAIVDVAPLSKKLVSQGISWISRKQSLMKTKRAFGFRNVIPRRPLSLTNESTAIPKLLSQVQEEKSSSGIESQASTTPESSSLRSPSPVPSLTSSVTSLPDVASPELRPLDSPPQVLGDRDLADLTGRLAIKPRWQSIAALPSHAHIVLDLKMLEKEKIVC